MHARPAFTLVKKFCLFLATDLFNFYLLRNLHLPIFSSSNRPFTLYTKSSTTLHNQDGIEGISKRECLLPLPMYQE